ncbi:MAG: response regulator transcription factor [Alphaproteobacteria bacterium]|nr:response regulator transcription factor [Alphaproteobacteria bacterium]
MKILIADDHELFLKGLEFVLSAEFDDSQIITVKNYVEIFEQLQKQNDFDLIVTDLAMPGANWLQALEKIHGLAKDTPIVIISAVFDNKILQKTLEIGVAGYIPKSSSNKLILSAIHLVLAGGVYIPQEMLSDKTDNQDVSQEMNKLKTLDENNETKTEKKLTPRQIEVVRAIGKGLSNKLIAYQLGLTEGTVKVHITVILKILGVTNRTAAVIEAVKQGYINKEDAYL